MNAGVCPICQHPTPTQHLAEVNWLSAAALAGLLGRLPMPLYAVPGKITVFDFTSKYCGPCQAYNEPLAKLHAQRADVAVVKVDINRPETKGIDWKSPVALQYGLRSIPHFKIIGPDGKLMAEDREARAMVNQFIAALK